MCYGLDWTNFSNFRECDFDFWQNQILSYCPSNTIYLLKTGNSFIRKKIYILILQIKKKRKKEKIRCLKTEIFTVITYRYTDKKHKKINFGSNWSSEKSAYQKLPNSLKSLKIAQIILARAVWKTTSLFIIWIK